MGGRRGTAPVHYRKPRPGRFITVGSYRRHSAQTERLRGQRRGHGAELLIVPAGRYGRILAGSTACREEVSLVDSRERREERLVARTAILAALVATLVSILAVACGESADSEKAAASSNTPVSERLGDLKVRPAGSMEGYSRELFSHWSDAKEYGWTLPAGTPDPGSCDVRDAALIRDGRDEVVEQYCDVVSGKWFDPYGGATYADPADLDGDHFVPLANAYRSGASSWEAARRERFANVPRDVLIVDDGLNQSKGDKGPEAWKPPRRAYWCTYAKKWVGIKYHWRLSVTSAEKSALKQMLATCPSR